MDRSGASPRHSIAIPEIIACMRFILNVLWLIFGGLLIALAYAVAGVICCILIVTIPFGIASFRIANYALWPFGRTMSGIRTPERRPPSATSSGSSSRAGGWRWATSSTAIAAVPHDHRHPARHREHQAGAGLADAARSPDRRRRLDWRRVRNGRWLSSYPLGVTQSSPAVGVLIPRRFRGSAWSRSNLAESRAVVPRGFACNYSIRMRDGTR